MHKLLLGGLVAGVGFLAAVGGGAVFWIASMAPEKPAEQKVKPSKKKDEPGATSPMSEEKRRRLRGITPGSGGRWTDTGDGPSGRN